MIKKLLAIIVLVMALSVAGCTGIQNPLSGNQTSQVNAYANAFVSSFKANLGPGESLVSSNVVQNGSDAVQVTLTVANTTPTSIWSNGSTDTYALNVKQFDNTNDASNLYNSTTFGYNPSASTNGAASANAYQQVMGHAPTISRVASQTVSLSLFGESINLAAQQGEFVIYGAATAVPGASASTHSDASSSIAPTLSPSGSPSSNPSLISRPTSSPTSSPTASPTSTPPPAPTTTTKSVTIYAERGCPYCEAAIAQYTNEGYVITVLYPGDPGFVPQASYPGIVDTSTGGY